MMTTFIFNSCNSDDDNLNRLPPETQTGANTAGCLVNGKVFLPRRQGSSPELLCNYEYIDGEFYFLLNFADLRGIGFKQVFVTTGGLNLEEGQNYILNKNQVEDGDYMGGGGGYSTSLENNYYTNSTNTGELKITYIDIQNSIISGTFWFDAVNEAGELVEVREGRFDVQFAL